VRRAAGHCAGRSYVGRRHPWVRQYVANANMSGQGLTRTMKAAILDRGP